MIRFINWIAKFLLPQKKLYLGTDRPVLVDIDTLKLRERYSTDLVRAMTGWEGYLQGRHPELFHQVNTSLLQIDFDKLLAYVIDERLTDKDLYHGPELYVVLLRTAIGVALLDLLEVILDVQQFPEEWKVFSCYLPQVLAGTSFNSHFTQPVQADYLLYQEYQKDIGPVTVADFEKLKRD